MFSQKKISHKSSYCRSLNHELRHLCVHLSRDCKFTADVAWHLFIICTIFFLCNLETNILVYFFSVYMFSLCVISTSSDDYMSNNIDAERRVTDRFGNISQSPTPTFFCPHFLSDLKTNMPMNIINIYFPCV